MFLIIHDKVTSNRESKTSVKGTNTEYQKKKPLVLLYFVQIKEFKEMGNIVCVVHNHVIIGVSCCLQHLLGYLKTKKIKPTCTVTEGSVLH